MGQPPNRQPPVETDEPRCGIGPRLAPDQPADPAGIFQAVRRRAMREGQTQHRRQKVRRNSVRPLNEALQGAGRFLHLLMERHDPDVALSEAMPHPARSSKPPYEIETRARSPI